MPARRHVALIIETSNAYSRGLLRGIQAYAREHGSWSSFLPELGRGDRRLACLSDWQGDGIIARIENAAVARAVASKKVPTIDVSAARLLPQLPWVETDDAAIARLAADHLRSQGLRHFAFHGDAAFAWARARERHFEAAISDAGLQYHGTAPRRGLEAWLLALPKPVGLFAGYDISGRELLEACQAGGVRVPDEAAVVGVDNDDLLCELAVPSLTSIIPNTLRTGYEAAALLDRCMNGEAIPPEGHFIPPLGIAERQSSDVLAVSDPLVAHAVHFIRDHAHEGVNVAAVARAAGTSRRVLEHRYRKVLGRTPHEDIVGFRLKLAQRLLFETELPIAQIADRAGFEHAEYLTVLFKRECGVTPRGYRAAVRF